MIIGTLRLELQIPHAHSLKEKRGPLKSLLAQLENRFRCAVAEVAYQDLHQRAAVAAALVGSEGKIVAQRLQSIRRFAENRPDMIVLTVKERIWSGEE